MLPVLAMRPRYVEKLWGGTRLAALPAKQRAGHAPPPGKIGESWEVADIAEGTSVVDGGPFDGRTLRSLVVEHRRALVGERAQPSADGVLRFPLLVKLIDADDDLSVQVHPGDEYCASHPGTFSKDEAWLVVDAAPGARVLHGTKPSVTRASFERALAAGRVAEELREVPARVGDLLRIPPGTVHAVGRGCVLLEVQEPSDTTFRVFDYNRTDATGKPRPLHVEQALAVARFGDQPPTHVRAPIEAARFALALYEIDIGNAPELVAADPFVVHALTGTVVIDDHTGARTLPRGATCIVPPHVRVVLQSDAPAHVAVMSPR